MCFCDSRNIFKTVEVSRMIDCPIVSVYSDVIINQQVEDICNNN